MKTAEQVAQDCRVAYGKWFDDQLKQAPKGRLLKDIMEEGEKYAFEFWVSEIRSYAEQCVKEHLSRGAENARTRTNDESTSIIVDRESITNIDIELI